jgi:hypothetical protein
MNPNGKAPGGPDRLFVMAGMPRAGTTYMYEALKAHPSIFLPFRKELSYFSSKYEKGESWYMDFFAEARPGQVCADISPDYFVHSEAVDRIQRFKPRPKVALAIREPASWALSYHRHLATFEWRVPGFEQFITRHRIPDNRILRLGGRGAGDTFAIRESFVRTTVERFRAAFGSDLLIYSFDAFRKQPFAVIRALERFLGLPASIDPSQMPPNLINAGGRRNIRILSYLVSREEIVTAAGAVLPRRLLRSVRSRFDRISAPSASPVADPNHGRDLQLAKTVLADDIQYYERLFSSSPIQLGDGQAFS